MLLSYFPRAFQNKVFETTFKSFLDKEAAKGYKYFSDPREIETWAIKYVDYFENLIYKKHNLLATDGEKRIICSYEYYAGWGGGHINGYLRGFSTMHDPEYLNEKIRILDLELLKFKLDQNLIAVRRIPSCHLIGKINGDEFIDDGYLSTSLNTSYRLDEDSKHKLLFKDTVFIIKIPAETHAVFLEVEYISKRDEYELLLPRSTRLKVELIKTIGTNQIIITSIM